MNAAHQTLRELYDQLLARCNGGFENEFEWANWKKKHQPEIDALPMPLRRAVEAAWENSGPKGL